MAKVHLIVDAIRDLPPGLRADLVHVRNKTASARELIAIARHYVALGERVTVNTRADVALAAGAAGVHLPSRCFFPPGPRGGPVIRRIRAIGPAGFLTGVSCHTREELEHAQAEGADYAYLAPVFTPLSKVESLPPLGLDGFARIIQGLTIPVLALGGITADRIDACVAAGAAGVAGITLGFGQDR